MSSPVRTAVVVWVGLLVLGVFEISQPDLRFWSVPAFSAPGLDIARLPAADWRPVAALALFAFGSYAAFLLRPRFERR